MEALELFLERYDAVQIDFVEQIFTGLTEDDVRRRPHDLNSIAWLVWHVARVQDAVVSRFVADRPQVLDEGDWRRRLAIARCDVGSGMTGEEVSALSAAIVIPALRAYQSAVAERTKVIAMDLRPAAWDEVVPPERVRQVVAGEQLLIEAGRWVADFWAGARRRGWLLLQVGLLHPYGHWFDALVTRGALDGKSQ